MQHLRELAHYFARPLPVAGKLRGNPLLAVGTIPPYLSVPVLLILAGEDGELGGQGVVEPLHQPVTLRMEWCCPHLVHPQLSTDLTKDLLHQPLQPVWTFTAICIIWPRFSCRWL